MAGQCLTLKQIAEVKQHEAMMNAIRKRTGRTKHPMTAVIWGCGCCYGYSILEHRTIADTTVQEEEKRRKEPKVYGKYTWEQKGKVKKTYGWKQKEVVIDLLK